MVDGIYVDGKHIRSTSIEVYHQMRDEGLLSERRWEAYDILFRNGPMTSNEIFEHARLHGNPDYRHNTNARMTELRELGVVKEIGTRPCRVTGRTVIEWDVTDKLPSSVPSKREKKMKLFNLKKTSKEGVCDANRCKKEGEHAMPGFLWGLPGVKLCTKHGEAAVAFAEENPGYKPPEAPPVPVPAAAPNQAELEETLRASKADAEEVLTFLRSYEINTAEDLTQAGEWLRDVKQKRAELEAKEKGITAPINTALQKVRALFRPTKKFWADAEVILKSKIGAQKLLEEQNNAKALAAAAAAHAAGDPEATVAATSQVKHTSDLEGITIISKWTYVIEDEELFMKEAPNQFKMPNVQMLKEHCNHSTDKQPAAIPGVKFIPDAQVRASASN